MKILQSLAMMLALLALPAAAQDASPETMPGSGVDPAIAQSQNEAADAAREGAPTSTLADILRRQEGLETSDGAERAQFVGDGEAPASASGSPLGTLGGSSDADLWRALRFDEREIRTQVRGPAADTIIQDNGMWWLQLREGPVLRWGGYLLLGTIALLAIFYLVKGRVEIEGPKTGRTIERFKGYERFGHWLISVSFVILGLTGLITLMGRKFLIPAFGHEAFASFAVVSKWLHNNVAWAFMAGLIIVFVQWVVHNLPDRTDLNWLAKGGGILTDGHPPAKKFNAGQKLIFWSVVIFGASISVSGLALLFPFQFQLFGPTFAHLNDWGIPGLLGMDPLPAETTAYTEMMYSQLWHTIVSFVLMAIIIAHIYIGSIGMEGAFAAMGSGKVEEQWAVEHHSIWAEEKLSEDGAGGAYSSSRRGHTPAE